MPDGLRLAGVHLARVGERVSAVRLELPTGEIIHARISAGAVEPVQKLPAGTTVRLDLTVQRAGWLGWLVGSSVQLHTVINTPAVRPSARIVTAASGRPVDVRFTQPVVTAVVQLGTAPRQVLHLRRPTRIVPLGITASGATTAGTALVAGTSRSWLRLPKPTRISWFPPAPTPEVLVRPAPTTTLAPTTPIVFTFSRPISAVLGDRHPTVWPRTQGTWSQRDDHTLVFQPGKLGFPLGATVRIGLTRAFGLVRGSDPTDVRTLTWPVPTGSARGLEVLLSQLGYLPLVWHPSADRLPASATSELQTAIDPTPGSFGWRYRTPATLKSLWQSAAGRAAMVRGAIMAFESTHNLPTDGVASPQLWSAILRRALTPGGAAAGYSYVYVTETLPETLTLWHDGRVVLTSPINTGIPQAPTALGTYAVYEHLASTTMSGTNPNGTKYSDPGVPWVNYFNGGDAVHGFVRASYGFPQSLGCVEAPITTAAKIWPYVQVGTLVTIAA